MITELTPKQTAQIGVYHANWLAIGLKCERADRPRAEKSIKAMYAFASQKEPQFAWCRSPREARDKYDCGSAWFVGQQDSYWICFYLYCRDILGVKYEQKYSALLNLHAEVAQSCGWWYPFEHGVIVCERPLEVHMKNGVLHKDGGMAIRFSDGFGSWNLNGVRVSRALAETRAEDLDPAILIKEQNAEVRREIVRKIGIERIVQKLGAEVLDRSGDYELVTLGIGDGRRREFLKMKNPSIGVYHIEGVPPGTKTVAEALTFRNGRADAPARLT